MSSGYQIEDQSKAYFLTLQIVEWVDLFTRQVYRDILIRSLDYCRRHKGLEIYAYVVMSNHVHLIVRSEKGQMSATIGELKSYTSKVILDFIKEGPESRSDWMLTVFSMAAARHQRNANFQIWTHENHAIELFSQSFFEEKLNYIHQNPVRAGWVHHEDDYVYSSASAYAGKKGILEVDFINVRWKTVR